MSSFNNENILQYAKYEEYANKYAIKYAEKYVIKYVTYATTYSDVQNMQNMLHMQNLHYNM